MLKKLYVGNLPFSARENEVEDFFAQYGNVQSVNLISDRDTGKPRGFGFIEVELENPETDIQSLDGTEFMGRNLRVNEAVERGGGKPRGRRREW